MMISLSAACAACLLSGCLLDFEPPTDAVVTHVPSPVATTTPTPQATTRTPSPTPTTPSTSPSPTREAFAYAVPREPEPTVDATTEQAPPPAPPEEAAPAPQRYTQAPEPVQQHNSVYYKNCQAARNAGAAPLYRGDPGYRSGLDADGDGIACEWSKKKRH